MKGFWREWGRPGEAGVARLQGGYYLVTGLWPIVHLRSFEAVTGPKPEGWLVKMVGALAASVGLTLLGGRAIGPTLRTAQSIRRLGLLSALSFAGVDLWYGGVRRRIAPVYALEALPELAFAAYWARHQRS